jgi:hypothetical protein
MHRPLRTSSLALLWGFSCSTSMPWQRRNPREAEVQRFDSGRSSLCQRSIQALESSCRAYRQGMSGLVVVLPKIYWQKSSIETARSARYTKELRTYNYRPLRNCCKQNTNSSINYRELPEGKVPLPKQTKLKDEYIFQERSWWICEPFKLLAVAKKRVLV